MSLFKDPKFTMEKFKIDISVKTAKLTASSWKEYIELLDETLSWWFSE